MKDAGQLRLGVYSDLVYRSDGGTVSADRAFVRFVTSFAPRLSELVLFGRLDPVPGRNPYAIAGEGVRFVPLPYYPSVFSVRRLMRSLARSCRVFASELERVDAVWLFGPHPLALLFALIARRYGKPVILGVRQDYPAYIRRRLPHALWSWAAAAAHVLDLSYGLLARTSPTVAVGEELARKYRRGRAPVLATGVSLIDREDIVSADEALAKSWDGELRVLTVGRLDPEKNPMLLLEIVRALHASNGRWRLVVVGTGPLESAIRERAHALGLSDVVELYGYVPNGPALWAQYRASHAFLHVALTEGLPQVLFEAQAAGLPVVATAVGGVAAALGRGELGLLIPPDDAGAAASALARLARDRELRASLILAGLEHAKDETTERQVARVLEFVTREIRATA